VTPLPSELRRSYTLNIEHNTSVGSPLIETERLQYVEVKQWVGILNSSDGWQRTRVLTDDSFRESLIYTGRSGNTLRVSYREYRKDLARPAFFQDLTYDLGQSDIIVFRRYRVRVLEATNQFIRFEVLGD
jgi:hypothetical protein